MRTTLDFEDIAVDKGKSIVLKEYYSLTWTNMVGYEPDPAHPPKHSRGYVSGLTSGVQEVFASGSGRISHISFDEGTFTLKSAYVTSAFERADTVTAIGYRDGEQVYTLTFDINRKGPTLVQFDFKNIDDVSFDAQSFSQVVFDDMVFGSLPAPAVAQPSCRSFPHDTGPISHHAALFEAHLPHPDLYQLA